MPDLEITLRLIVIGQQLLIAAIFLSGRGDLEVRLSASALLMGAAAYVFNSSPILSEAAGPVLPFLAFLGIAVPYLLWLFSRAVFEAPWPNRLIVGIIAVAVVFNWAMLVFGERHFPRLFEFAIRLHQILSLVVVTHALWIAVSGRGDDLVEARRNFRVYFVVFVAAQVFAVLIAEITLGGAIPPGWLALTNVIVIAVLTLGLAIPTLRLNPDFFGSSVRPAVERPPSSNDDLDPATAVLKDKLLIAMDEGFYRETGLTIRTLARQLGYPEYRLRRLINGHLGFRNFSAFLNSLRVAEAKARLSDPEQVRRPVLTIAMDLGYASLGPFNRAFREITGMTPTAYRKAHFNALDEAAPTTD